MTTFVGIVHHRHGEDIFPGSSYEDVIRQIEDYCENWWEDRHLNQPMPKDRTELIEEYFKGTEEWYEIK